MKKIAAPLLVISLMFASSMIAQAETGIPLCADIASAEGTYNWSPAGTGQLTLSVLMRQVEDPETGLPAPNPTCEDVTYELWLVRDNPDGGDPANLLDVGATSEAELISSENGDGVNNVLEYDLTIADDDPTICVFSRTLGTRTTTTGGPVDENGNGNTNDDQHRQNEGNNSGGDKHDWETTTTTETFEYDRGPDAGCKALNLAFDTVNESSGGRGYN